MKKVQIIVFLFALSAFSFINFDKANQLQRKWVAVEMRVEGNVINETMLDRQRQSGLITILEFKKGGVYLLHLKTPKGRSVKRNTWKLTENDTQLHVKPEGNEPEQIFTVEKITSKKLILSLNDNGQRQVFIYKEYKE